MKAIHNYIIALILILFTSFSCEDLDEEVYSFYTQENYLVNEAQLKTQALGLYDFSPHSFYSDQLFRIVIMPNQYYASRNAGLSAAATIYAEGSSARSYASIWELFYRVIGRSNTLIKYGDNALVNESQETINQYKAEAYFFRAYCYFHLVRIWGPVPLNVEPVESNSFEALNKPGSDIETIYNQIISDLNFAKDNLPKLGWDDLPQGRIKAATAIQLLGLVHLTMAGKPLEKTENYQLAINVLEELTNNEAEYGVGLLSNWMDNWDNDNKVNSEKLFALGSTGVAGYGSVLPFRITPPAQVGYAVNGAYQYAVSYDLYQLYEDEDVRRNECFLFEYQIANGSTVTYRPDDDAAPRGYGGRNGLSHIKYTDGSAPSPITHLNEVFYMRYVDTFLILAEAYNEIGGNSVKALENLNIVRSRVNASSITETDQSLLRQIIRDERSRELFHEYTELYDIRRWGVAKENFENHPLRLKWNPSAQWDDKFLLAPIPLNELSRNQNLSQNPGW